MENKFFVALVSQVNGMAGTMGPVAAGVCTSGMFMMYDEFTCGSAEKGEAFFSRDGIEESEVSAE